MITIAITWIMVLNFHILHGLSKSLLDLIYKVATLGDFFLYAVTLFIFTIFNITSKGTKEYIVGGENAKFKKIRLAIYRFIIVTCVVLLSVGGYCKYISERFNHNIKFISNYSSDNETKELSRKLQVRWCQMSSRDEYRQLCSIMHNYAQKNNTKLPW